MHLASIRRQKNRQEKEVRLLMPRTGENIYKRKDGRWEGRYIKGKVGGKTRYGSVYAASYREVKEKVDAAKKKLKSMEQPSANAGKVADIGRQWLSEAALMVKESSTRKYEDIFRCYILPEFGEDELSNVTDKRIINFVDALLSEGV